MQGLAPNNIYRELKVMSDIHGAGSSFGLGSGGDASIFASKQFTDALGLVQSKLQQAAASPEMLTEIFGGGDKTGTAEFQSVIKQWSGGVFDHLPSIQILSAADMHGAAGAYASATQTIYLSDALFKPSAAPSNSVLGVAGVLTEETFHWLDDRVGVDTKGDEGESAKDLLFGVKLSDSELSRIKSEDDRGFVNVGGQKLLVEQASIVGNSAGNTLIGTNLADVMYGYQGNDSLNGNGGNDLLNGYGFTDNEKDTLTGGTGADRFVLGDANSVFYAKNGNSDYAVITDFNRAEGDAIALKKLAFNNSSGDRAYGYRLVTVGVNTEIRVDNTNELVATLQNRTGVSLLQGFVFDGTPALRTGQANTDVDGDGKDDIIAANKGSGVFVKLSTGSSFGATQQWQSGGFAGNGGTFLADVNGDGKADIIAANKGSGVFVKLSTGSSFGATQQWQSGGFAGNEGTFLGSQSQFSILPINSGDLLSLPVDLQRARLGINTSSSAYLSSGNKFVSANKTGGTYLWCTDYAFGRALEKGLIQNYSGIGGSIKGHAGSWDDNTNQFNKVPRKNSFIIWDPYTPQGPSYAGHVGFVEEVYADGSFLVSESNRNDNMSFSLRLVKPGESAYINAKFVYL